MIHSSDLLGMIRREATLFLREVPPPQNLWDLRPGHQKGPILSELLVEL
jgi:hypothetical protein